MKIGIITTSFPRWRADYTGAFIYEAARAIQQQGLQVKVISMHAPGTARHENWDGIEIYRTRYLPEAWELLKSEGGGLPEVWKNNPKARPQIFPFMLAFLIDVFIHTRDCDLLHANWTISGAIAWIISIFNRKPYFVTIQGSDIYKAVKLPLVTSITRAALNHAKKILVLSKALAQQVNLIGIPLSKIEIVPNGVDTSHFIPLPYEQRENQILFVGSLIERKGVQHLIQAFAPTSAKYPDTHLILVGEGLQRSMCEDMVRSLGLEKKVHFAGAQPQEQVAENMRKARVFVLPSIEEGLGVVLLEALASGTPIVASNVGGIADVVDEKVGVLVPPGDAGQLAGAIQFLLNLTPLEWTELNSNARKRAIETYDWEQIARRIVRIYSN
jgi:glycosyltransferase involved in cell wall biosynthesis